MSAANVVVSHFQAKEMLRHIDAEENRFSCSLDLGRTESQVYFSRGKVRLPDGQTISKADLEKMAGDKTVCYFLEKNRIYKIMFFSEKTKRFYKLHPTERAPTIEISGILMHRVKNIDPLQDARQKIAMVAPLKGSILDTCCGLGYTAILAAAVAEKVTVIEKDPNVLEIARQNPWSRELFEAQNISLIEGDASRAIREFPDESFDCVIHDPPTFRMAEELYTREFYSELFRVIKKNGKLFHYVGQPGARFRGVDLMKSVSQRLAEIGFREIILNRKVGGVSAKK